MEDILSDKVGSKLGSSKWGKWAKSAIQDVSPLSI